MGTIINIDASHFANASYQMRTETLDDIYTGWMADMQQPMEIHSIGLGDDGASLAAIPPLWPMGGDRAVVSFEGGLEFAPYAFGNPGSSYAHTVQGVNRYYSLNVGRRLAVIFHPPGTDTGLASFSGAWNSKLAVFRGVVDRSSAQNVQFIARVVPGRQLDIAVKNTLQASGLPMHWAVLDGTTAAAPVQLAMIPQGGILHATFSLFGGTVSGTVVDQAGNPATRIVRAHERSTGNPVGSTRSSAQGTYELPVLAKPGTELYMVALDDDTPPLINAVIADRIVLE